MVGKLPLPENAPELWPGKCHTSESLPEFFERVWGPYVNSGLTIARLKNLDRPLWSAIMNYRGKLSPAESAVLPLTPRMRLASLMNEYSTGNLDRLTPDDLVRVARKLQRDAAKAVTQRDGSVTRKSEPSRTVPANPTRAIQPTP
jgi:hypothetical protein